MCLPWAVFLSLVVHKARLGIGSDHVNLDTLMNLFT